LQPKSLWAGSGRAILEVVTRTGNLLMFIGAGVILLGALVRFAPGLFGWFGNLPGDVRIEGQSSRVFIPITSMVVVSVVITVVVNVAARLFRNG
jgi:hypothetical protein